MEDGKIFVLTGTDPFAAFAAKQDFQVACQERFPHANRNKTRRLFLLLDPLQKYISKGSRLGENFLSPMWDSTFLSASGMSRVINCWVTRSETGIFEDVAESNVFFQSFLAFIWLSTDDMATNLRARKIIKDKSGAWTEPSELSGLETMCHCRGRYGADDKLVKYPGQIDEIFIEDSEEEKQFLATLRRFYQALVEKRLDCYPSDIMEKHYKEGACVAMPLLYKMVA